MKTILVTGASSGFGKETAVLLARSGYYVFATLRNKSAKNKAATDDLLKIAAEEDLTLEVLEMDVTNQNSIKSAVQNVIDEAGKIDVLINNAGYGGYGWTEGFYTSQIREMFEVNFFGVLELNKAVLPFMRKQNNGLIIHISSILAKLPVKFMSGYNASKFAVEGYAESLNMETAHFDIQSVILQPGFFNTNFAGNMFYNADAERLEQLGELATLPQQMAEGYQEILQHMPPISIIADAALQLIEMPATQRPLRTVVSAEPHRSIVDRLNVAADTATNELNRAFDKTNATL